MNKTAHTASADIFENSFGLHTEDLYPLRQTYAAQAQKTLRLPYHINSSKSRQMQQKAEATAKLLRIALSILLFVAFTPFLQAQPGSITISGQVTSHPHQLPPHTTILAKDPDTQETLAQTQTDENGYYSLEIITTHTVNTATSEAVFSLIPNPFGRHATLLAWLPSAGNYTLAAYDLFGRLILKETLQAQPGLNRIQVELPPAKGLVIITLQGENFRKTLKALQNRETGLTDNSYSYNHFNKLNKSLTPCLDTQQNQAINWQIDTGNRGCIADIHGYRKPADHDRSFSLEKQQSGFSQGMQAPGMHNPAMYGTGIQAPGMQVSGAEQYIKLMFASNGHEQKDTLISRESHERINVDIVQIPYVYDAEYFVNVLNDPLVHLQGVHHVANIGRIFSYGYR